MLAEKRVVRPLVLETFSWLFVIAVHLRFTSGF